MEPRKRDLLANSNPTKSMDVAEFILGLIYLRK